MFESERQGLEHLTGANAFVIPQPLVSGVVGKHSFLVMQYLNLHTGEPPQWQAFGQNLARLHQHAPQEMYGWQDDNYIGMTIQMNKWHKKWNQFFAEQRIGLMLQLLDEKGHRLVDIDRAVNSIADLLAGHQPMPSMLHGDLWLGNCGFSQKQTVIFDPAFYYGDREVDLAMTEVFGRFPDAFYLGYQQAYPLPEEYLYRKPVYQLYPVLNHALMFSGQYLQSARSLLQNLEG